MAGVKLLEACNGLRDHHVAYAHRVHEELHQRAERLQLQLERQRTQAATLAQAVSGEQGIKQHNAQLTDRITRMQQVGAISLTTELRNTPSTAQISP